MPTTTTPTAELDARFSTEEARPTEWATATQVLDATSLYLLSTVRADGRPHVTPVMGIWRDDVLHFCCGPDEQKGRNLAANAHCAMSVGTATVHDGLDVVVEGVADRVTDDAQLHVLATAWETKYGPDWHYDVANGAFRHHGGEAHVFAVRTTKVLAFQNGEAGGQTRWRLTAS